MSLLIFLLLTLVALSLLAGILRRIPVIAGLAVAFVLSVLAWSLWHAPLDETIEIFGRTLLQNHANALLNFTFRLTPSIRPTVLLLLIWGALFSLIAALSQSERILYPTIPLLIATLILFLSSTPLLWATLWLMLAAIIMAVIAQGNRPRSARAALRTLLAPTLAFPFFLFAAWVFSQTTIAAEAPELWNNAWKALIIGMLILTSPVPLHGWITALGESASPFAGAFLVGVWQIAIYAFLRQLLFSLPIITDFIDPGLWLPWIAVIQMLWAGIFMFGSQRLGQLWGYLLLWSYGAAFLAWGLTGEFGSQAIFWLFLTTPIALVLTAAGMQSIIHRFGENPAYDHLHGVTERMPLSSLGVIAGGLFLLGWPLGALFPMRLATFQVAEFRAGDIFLWTMLALSLGVLGIIRATRRLAGPLRDVNLERESPTIAWTIGILLTASMIIALNPGLLSPAVQQLLTWFNML